MIERGLVGGVAHLWDCIPAQGDDRDWGRARRARRCRHDDGAQGARVSSTSMRCAKRLSGIETGALQAGSPGLLESQGVRLVHGAARLKGPTRDAVDTATGTEELEADTIVLSTGSRPRVPECAAVDGDRILTTRQAYPPPEIPTHLIVVGSGVTGVEFTHMFAPGSRVTLSCRASRSCRYKDPEVAAVLEEGSSTGREAPQRRPRLIGDGPRRRVHRCNDGRGSTACTRLCLGSVPTPKGSARRCGCRRRRRRLHPASNPQLPDERRAHLRPPATSPASAPLVGRSDAGSQDRRTHHGPHHRPHRHLDYDKAAPRSSPIPRSPTSVSPRPRRSRRAARSRYQGAVLVEPEVPHQRRPAWLRQDPLRPRDRSRARWRIVGRAAAKLSGDRGRGDERAQGRRHRRLAARPPRSRNRWPKPPRSSRSSRRRGEPSSAGAHGASASSCRRRRAGDRFRSGSRCAPGAPRLRAPPRAAAVTPPRALEIVVGARRSAAWVR